MKTSLIVLLLAIATPVMLHAQTSATDLPQEVKIQFMENYISASNVQWQKDRQNRYMAKFTHQSQDKLTSYTGQGSWLFTETSMVLCQLPVELRETLFYNYNDADILEVKRVETQTQVTYHIVLKENTDAEYTPDGTLLRLTPAAE